MIILGIDPGIANTGYGIVKSITNKVQPLHYGHIKTSSKEISELRLKTIYDTIIELIDQFKVDEVVLEDIFFNKNVNSAIVVGEVKGIVKLAGANTNSPVTTYTPLQVKQSVVGYGKAEKIQVQRMVQALLKLKELPKPDHAADALALAICHARSHKLLHLKESISAKLTVDKKDNTSV
ncbi:crossover junction endodeoxyribonuclease RuvC [Candidatus Poribacteria bacterium]|nr:MAG: crossover junction endodeoxyribonuclease RuvC [Candidatus Poribacteria bacterium]